MQIAWRRGLFPVLVALGVCLTVTTGIRAEELPPREGNLRPDEVLVVANALSEESLAVARHYMARRNIPADHLFRIRYADFDALEPMDQNPKWMPFDQFREDVAEPLEAFLETSGLRDRILCLVCVVDTPYRVGGFDLTAREHYELETRLSHPAYRRASAEAQEKFFEKQKRRLWEANSAFDSELAWRFLPEPSPMDRAGLARREGLWRWFANPYCGREESFRAFRRRQIESGRPERLYMVARLDGLSAENAMGLVDKAIQAEREGVAGTAYFDARNEGHKKKGYGLGDWWIRRAWEITRRAGLPTERNTDGGQFAPGTCQDALIYWGFYHP
ncbi:MAG: TIGR03790 family protein, partial [Planctomycetota bacterium]